MARVDRKLVHPSYYIDDLQVCMPQFPVATL